MGLLQLLMEVAPAAAKARFKLTQDSYESTEELMEAACKGRGWLLSGGRFDTDRASALILDEFRAGKAGKITLELPEDIDDMLEKKAAREAEKALLDKERKRADNKKKK